MHIRDVNPLLTVAQRFVFVLLALISIFILAAVTCGQQLTGYLASPLSGLILPISQTTSVDEIASRLLSLTRLTSSLSRYR